MNSGRHLSARETQAIAAAEREQRGAEIRHLTSCRSCRDELDRLRSLLRVMALRGAAHRPRVPLSAALAAVREVVPTLPQAARKLKDHSPTSMSAAPPGLRNGAAARQWLFAAGDLEVEIQAFPEGPEDQTLLGQITGHPETTRELTVHLRHEGDQALVLPDELGRFALAGVHGQAVNLLIESASGIFEIGLGRMPAASDDEPQTGS